MNPSLDFVPHAIEILRDVDSRPHIAGLEIDVSVETDHLSQARKIGHNLLWTGIEIDADDVRVVARLYFVADESATAIDVIYSAAADSASIVWDSITPQKAIDGTLCFCAANTAKKFNLAETDKPVAVDIKAFLTTIDALVEHASALAERDRIRA